MADIAAIDSPTSAALIPSIRPRSLTREYKSWQSMRERCHNRNHVKWRLYGGRGIAICARWDSFDNFLADMGPRPEGKTLDRFPNTDGNYEPGNCRWATAREQVVNRHQQTHCKRGHELSGDNVFVRTTGGQDHRECLACRRSRNAARHHGRNDGAEQGPS